MNLTPAELAARLRMHVVTLARWRCEGKGPAWWKPSPTRVLYALEKVEAWERARQPA